MITKSISTRKKIVKPFANPPLFPLACQNSVDGRYKLWFDHNGMPACTNFMRPDGHFCAICGNCCITFKVNQDADVICSACAVENGSADGAA